MGQSEVLSCRVSRGAERRKIRITDCRWSETWNRRQKWRENLICSQWSRTGWWFGSDRFCKPGERQKDQTTRDDGWRAGRWVLDSLRYARVDRLASLDGRNPFGGSGNDGRG